MPVSPGAPDLPTPTGGPARITLRLWTSPDVAPSGSTPSGQIFASQIAAFEAANPNVLVEVRVKKTSGAGGLLDFMHTSATAAPAALPDVVLVSRDDLAASAADSLIQPLTPLLAPDALAGFYPMAAEAVQAGGQAYGLPLYAEATALAYNTELRATPPITWTDVLSPTGTYLLPLGDPLGLVTLQQYLSAGGTVRDESGALTLQAAPLAQVLDFYSTASTAGVLPTNNAELLDATATWIAYREQRAALAAAPASLYLRERDRAGATAATVLPTLDGTPLALGTVWSFALVSTDPARQPLALALMQWLTSPANMGEWTEAAGFLPAQAAALESWADPLNASFAGTILGAGVLQPPAADLAVLGPLLKQAVTDVLAGRFTPQAAAARAAATFAPP